MHGRDTELARIARLVEEGRQGRSGALVVRGTPGMGKTTLLDHAALLAGAAPARGPAAASTLPMNVVRLAGLEAEQDLPYAGIHLLTRALPPPGTAPRPGPPTAPTPTPAPLPRAQAQALDIALGRTAPAAPAAASATPADPARHAPDRFLIGLAVLNLLAAGGPLLCLVDDAQWLDRASGDALLFAARRLGADPVVMIFAARDGFEAPGLPELPLGPLDAEAQRRVLDEREPRPAPAERAAIIEAAEGNPLALAELRAAPSVFAPLPVSERVTTEYRRRIAGLPERTRLVLTVAAAAAGDLTAVLRAAPELGYDAADLARAEAADLVTVCAGTVRFRHPLVRSAAYQAAPLSRRLEVHGALAAVAQDPYVRARHRTATATGPDEEIAGELERIAADAWRRTAYAASADAYEQAARLTSDPRRQGTRLTGGARSALRAGQPERVADLAERAARLTEDPAHLAELAFVQAQAHIELQRGPAHQAVQLLLARAAQAAPHRRTTLLGYAATSAWAAGDLPSLRRAGLLHEELRPPAPVTRPEARPGPRPVPGPEPEPEADAAAVRVNVPRALALLAEGGYGEAFPPLAALVASVRAEPPREPAPRLAALDAALLSGEDEAALELAHAEVALCRADGVIVALPRVLRLLAQAQLAAGLYREATGSVTEAQDIARSTGVEHQIAPLNAVLAHIAAIEGDEERCRRLAAASPPAAAGCALGLLHLGHGRYQDAVRALRDVTGLTPGYPSVAALMSADLVEAAVRAELPAAAPLEQFTSWATATRQPWARAVAERARGLAEGTEEPLAAAVRLHTGRPFERARSELSYGEWLRRQRRRTDARPLLKSALETFERLKAACWAERARTELRATGEQITAGRAADVLDRLTAQELQIVRLAAAGVSNRDIAGQLFLSTRTVEYHLYKAYPKLGVGSRRELSAVLRSDDA
ncbi:LuxR family transcriptional regulator [Streptomyces sp. MST-110588]|uniref:AAA family ATPase n=1 Tax=Streptomyces sp. MST-110588 TaxID=2833628 RepID=UPI001F5CFADA|nr:LuxR family transcriptional regulator [Streptomyces sp. MST-110588]